MTKFQTPQIEWNKPLTEDPGSSYTMPSRYYIDPEIYRRDLIDVFYRTWQYIGHRAQFKKTGDYVATRIANQSIVVLKGKDGALKGFHNVCRHRGHELLSGEGNTRRAIVCPYHAWAYDLDGTLKSGRFLCDMSEFECTETKLTSIRVETLGPFVFANIDPEAISLADIAGDMLEDMRAKISWLDDTLEIRASYSSGESTGMAANWKVTLENFIECYHCPVVHPAWADLTDGMGDFEVDWSGYWSSQHAPTIRHQNRAYNVDKGAPQQEGFFWTLWPNTTFNFMPGERSIIVMCVHPLEPERSDFTGHVMYPPSEAANHMRVDYASKVLGMEDQRICESVQRGLHSMSFDQGRIVSTEFRRGLEEHTVHWFHWLLKGVYESKGPYPPTP